MKSNVSLSSQLIASTYDILLVFSLCFCIGLFTVVTTQNPEEVSRTNLQDPRFFALYFTLTYGYFALSWVKGRQTLGMKSLKFEVLQTNGSNITYLQSLIRFLLSPLSFLMFVFPLLNKNKLSLRDFFSKTYLNSTKK